MTLRRLLSNFGLYAFCLATSADLSDIAVEAAATATSVAHALAVGERVDLDALRRWNEPVDIDCLCFPHDSAPVAPACAND